MQSDSRLVRIIAGVSYFAVVFALSAHARQARGETETGYIATHDGSKLYYEKIWLRSGHHRPRPALRL